MTSKMADIQLTLTFRKDLTIREGNSCIFLWLNKVDRAGLQIKYRFVPELGKKIKLHYHGYFEWDPSDTSRATLIHYMIYRWKQDYGYYYESHGELNTWLAYIDKQVRHHADLGIKAFIPITEDTLKKHRHIAKLRPIDEDIYTVTDQTAIDLEYGLKELAPQVV